MRYELRIPVFGTALIKRDHAVEVNGIRFDYFANPAGQLTDVAASVEVEPGEVRTFAGAGTGGVDREFRIEGASASHARTLSALQQLESHLAFASESTITGFDWHDVAWKLVPETDAERKELNVYSGRVTARYPKLGSRLSTDLLDLVAQSTVTRCDTGGPKAFFREGENDMVEQRFIQAFYNFYFVIEGMFGNGKVTEYALAMELLTSDEYVTALVTTLGQCKDPWHVQNLSQLHEEEGLPADLYGTTRLLIRVRGLLHHYSVRGRRRQGTPFNQADWHSVSLFMMALATNVLTARDFQKGPFYIVGEGNVFTVDRRSGRANPR